MAITTPNDIPQASQSDEHDEMRESGSRSVMSIHNLLSHSPRYSNYPLTSVSIHDSTSSSPLIRFIFPCASAFMHVDKPNIRSAYDHSNTSLENLVVQGLLELRGQKGGVVYAPPLEMQPFTCHYRDPLSKQECCKTFIGGAELKRHEKNVHRRSSYFVLR
jgi:hypothetical protein